nr:dual specificity protein kinase splA-like [Ipomoea batatas]
MCSSETKLQAAPNVLQPNRNRVSLLERRSSLKKPSAAAVLPLPPPSRAAPITTTPPASPKIKSPRQPAVKRSGNDPNGLNSSAEKVSTPKPSPATLLAKKSKKGGAAAAAAVMIDEPGSIAAARREQVAIMQVQRKMRIAHYGRTKSAKYEGKVASGDFSAAVTAVVREEKRCSFITPNSDPVYVAYHDEEWGVPVHNDNMLFELLVLTGAQVGSDWTIVLKKRQDFRDAFSGFDAEAVSKYTEKKITSVSADYGIELSQVRGAVDNSIRILEVLIMHYYDMIY